MLQVIRNKYERPSLANNELDRRRESKENQDLRNNPCLYMFYTPKRLCDNDEERNLSMPDCDDFLVFHIKKTKFQKVVRLFQCHCQ